MYKFEISTFNLVNKKVKVNERKSVPKQVETPLNRDFIYFSIQKPNENKEFTCKFDKFKLTTK